jgi:hypothetical protein
LKKLTVCALPSSSRSALIFAPAPFSPVATSMKSSAQGVLGSRRKIRHRSAPSAPSAVRYSASVIDHFSGFAGSSGT